MFGNQTSWAADYSASPTLIPSLPYSVSCSHTRRSHPTLYFSNDPRPVLPTSSSPFPSSNNEKAKTVSKEASVYFGFISVLRVVHLEFKPPRINLYDKFLLQLNISSQTNHPIIGKSDLSGTNFPTLVLLSCCDQSKTIHILPSEQWAVAWEKGWQPSKVDWGVIVGKSLPKWKTHTQQNAALDRSNLWRAIYEE